MVAAENSTQSIVQGLGLPRDAALIHGKRDTHLFTHAVCLHTRNWAPNIETFEPSYTPTHTSDTVYQCMGGLASAITAEINDGVGHGCVAAARRPTSQTRFTLVGR